MEGFIGCYLSKDNDKNCIKFYFDEDKHCFSHEIIYYPIQDAKYLALEDNYLYALSKRNGYGFTRINLTDGSKLDQFKEASTACYIALDNNYIYTANYHDGCVHIYDKNSLALVKWIEIGLKAGCHQVVMYDHYILVPCLLLDRINIYDCNDDFTLVNTLNFDDKCGPRHCIFNQDLLYVVTELSNEVYEFKVNTINDIKLMRKVSLLEDNKAGASAAIRLSNNGKYLYVSVRDINVIKVIDTTSLSIMQTVTSGGNHPRDITLSKDNSYLFIVNRLSNNCVVYSLDENTGMCKTILDSFDVTQGISIVLNEN